MPASERDRMLREMARHRGFRLVKSRRRKPGGDFGRFGLMAAESGEKCLGFATEGLTATADEVEDFLRQSSASRWKNSLGKAARPKKSNLPRTKGKREAAAAPTSASKTKPVGRRAKNQPSSASTESEPNPRIREADLVDAEAVSRLISDFAPASSDEVAERLSLLRRHGEAPLVARLGEEIVGIITWHVTPVLHRPHPVGRITYLQVDEKRRRQGIGRALVEAVETRVKARGCGLVEVTSNVKLNRAHLFYKAMGYSRTSYRFAKDL